MSRRAWTRGTCLISAHFVLMSIDVRDVKAMARSVSDPWVWPAIHGVLAAPEPSAEPGAPQLKDGPHPLRPRLVQVNDTCESKGYLIISDKESLVAVFLTEEARQALSKTTSRSFSELKYSIVKLDRWVVSTVMLCCDALVRPMDRVDVKLSPICLQCTEITYVGGENCNIFGAPTWVNDRRELKDLLSQMESTAALHERLAKGQRLRALPDCRGEWSVLCGEEHVDMEDYGAMLQQDGVDPQALKGTSTGPAGGGSGVHRAAEHEEEGQGDMAEESQFGLSPDKSSQDFLTQQLETQPPASQQGQASPAGTSAGKRKALGASGHKDDGNGGQGEATPQTRSPKKPRRADNVRGGTQLAQLLASENLDFQTQPADILALTQQVEPSDDEMLVVDATQVDDSPLLDMTQRDAETEDEGDGGQEETKASGLPRPYNPTTAQKPPTPSVPTSTRVQPSTGGGGAGKKSGGAVKHPQSAPTPKIKAQAATSGTSSKDTAAGEARQSNGDAITRSPSGKAKMPSRPAGPEKQPRPQAPRPKVLFGGKTTIWHSWGFLRAPSRG